MNKIEMLWLALYALEDAEINANCEYEVTKIIRAALAQPDFKPVTYRTDKGAMTYCSAEFASKMGWHAIAQPQPQPQRKPLTDAAIMKLCSAQWASHPIEVARAIEAAHGIG